MQKRLILAVTLCAAACGSDKSKVPSAGEGNSLIAPAGTGKFANNASKMAQQATVSTQSQADQSEVATSGSDPDANASDPVMSKRKGGALEVRGWNQLAGMGNINGDFDVTLSFDQYGWSNQATANGNVNVHVSHGKDGSQDVSLSGTLTESYTHNGQVQAAFEPNFVVTKNGDRGKGRVTRELTGTVHRALKEALSADADFDFYIDHSGTTVTDLYVSETLSSRSISGTITVTDATSDDTGKLVFTNVVRPKPSECLCPESGTIQVSYTSGSTINEQYLIAFGSTCGEVTLTPQSPAGGTLASTSSSAGASAAQGNTTVSTSTAPSAVNPAAQIPVKMKWDSCIPG